MELSDVYMIVVFLAFALYILLDGWDLGIGIMTLFERDERRREEMHELVAWTWDGNESWLVLVALGLWTGVPLVTGIALPALYIPLMLMLWALIARGVSLEVIDQYDGWPPFWGRLFGVGSLVAAFCQGAAFGGVVAGLPVAGESFDGGPFTFLHSGYAVLTGFTAVALYLLAGAAWLYLRTDGESRRRAARTGRVAAVALAAGTVASWLLAEAAGPVTLDPAAGARLPVWIAGAALLTGGLAFAVRSFSTRPSSGRSDWSPVIGTLVAYGGGLMLALGLLYPTLVPPDITVHGAASPHTTLVFVTIATALIIPVILVYQTYAYRVFRGRVTVGRGATVGGGATP